MRSQRLLLATASALTFGCSSGASGDGGDDGAEGESEAEAEAEGEDAFFTLGPEFRDLQATSVLVYFETAEPSTCEARWGPTDALGNAATDPAMDPGQFVTEHRVPLTGLVPQTTYYVRAHAEVEGGTTFESNLVSFTTTALGSGPPNFASAALGATVIGKSSNFGGTGDQMAWGAGSAIDGSMATAWSSAGDGDDAWIDIVLSEAAYVDRIGFASRSMIDGTAITLTFQVVLGDGAVFGPFALSEPDVVEYFDVPLTLTDHVRYEAVTTTGGNTGAVEAEAYGVPSGG